MIKAILFDLDGTLLPIDQDIFTKAYFNAVVKKMVPFGYDVDELVKVIWAGTKGMVQNDGTRKNEDVFWKMFFEYYTDKSDSERKIFNDFYINNFDDIKSCCTFNSVSGEIVRELKEKGYTLILASNPIFPLIAQEKRMQWAGVDADDFVYITSYENSTGCKPNPAYYTEILNKTGFRPEECMMVGNDVTEDMIAKSLGMEVFLVTDYMLNKENKDISVYQRGSLGQMLELAKKMPDMTCD